jgi:hypothetical protein
MNANEGPRAEKASPRDRSLLFRRIIGIRGSIRLRL